MSRQSTPYLNLELAEQLGMDLANISRNWPLAYRSERDFVPLVEAWSHGLNIPVEYEHSVSGGKIDFKFKGTNPSVLELAVAPRILRDHHDEHIQFPGHTQTNQLYPSQNVKELEKLFNAESVKASYLLLLNLGAHIEWDGLYEGYKKYVNENVNYLGKNCISLVYVGWNKDKYFANSGKLY